MLLVVPSTREEMLPIGDEDVMVYHLVYEIVVVPESAYPRRLQSLGYPV
jgi:hypothetical protein